MNNFISSFIKNNFLLENADFKCSSQEINMADSVQLFQGRS